MNVALTDKQKKFCKEYVIDYNGTQAAIRAGYSEKTAKVQASQLLREEKILTVIKSYQKEQMQELCLSEEKVINDLYTILMHCMSAQPVMEWDYEEHDYVKTGEYQFDSKGALKAIELLGKHLGMFNGKNNKTPDVNDNSKEFKVLINSINNQAAEVWKNEDKA